MDRRWKKDSWVWGGDVRDLLGPIEGVTGHRGRKPVLHPPAYQQIAARIREAIAAGRLRQGQRVPGIGEISRRYGVSQTTVCNALLALETAKVVRRVDGVAFVRGEAGRCCDMHNQHCESPAELCCAACTEASHTGLFPHADGSPCVLDQQSGGGDVADE